jgi:peptide/nickel transport system permease protein
MAAYLTRRIGQIIFTIVAMSAIVFAVTQVLPGNVAYVIAGQFATPDQVAAIETRLGLHNPVWIQYAHWAGSALRGDFGTSFVMSRPVGALVADALARSAQLAGVAFVLIGLIGVATGVLSAVRAGGWFDRISLVLSWVSVAMPQFFVAIVLVLVLSGHFRWLPATGYTPISDGLLNWLEHLILPVLTLVIGLVAHVASLQRASMIEALGTSYVRAARAKGLSEWKVITRHALRNALIPTVTVLTLDLGILMGGIVVVETVFSYPGLGRLMLSAVEQKDLPVLQAGVLTVTVIYALANLAADLCYLALDPRLRSGHAGAR